MRIVLLLSLLALAACGPEGWGNKGSVLWTLTADENEKAAYTDDRVASARILCAQNYSGEGYDACVRNATKY